MVRFGARFGGRTKVLLVERVRALLVVERTFLSRHDVTILEAAAGPEALERAREGRPSVVVVNVEEPEGLELCRRLKADPETRDLPVVLVVGPDLRERAIEAGADALVEKPPAQEQFLRTIRRFVRLPERRGPRYPVNLRFTYRVGDDTGQVFSRALSPMGAFLKSDRTFSTGTRLDLRFHVPGDPREISCRGVVRMVVPFSPGRGRIGGIGVEFEDLDPADAERLERYLKKHQDR